MHLRLHNGEHPGDVESQVNVAKTPFPFGFRDEILFDQPFRVGQEDLEDMSSRFDVHSHGE